MKDLEKELEKSVGEIIIDLQREIRELEEENKKLKAELQDKQKVIQYYRKEKGKLKEENKKLKERINTMQEFIDYSEGVVQNAIGMLYEEGGEDKALDYLENCYATGDDKQYEEMERLYKDV